jgi:hypothetical protein
MCDTCSRFKMGLAYRPDVYGRGLWNLALLIKIQIYVQSSKGVFGSVAIPAVVMGSHLLDG